VQHGLPVLSIAYAKKIVYEVIYMNDNIDVQYKYNDHFKTEQELKEDYKIKLIESYAGKLLELMGSRTVLVYLGENDVVKVLESSGRMTDWVTAILDDCN